jgi:histidinol phosphatase-like enzyme
MSAKAPAPEGSCVFLDRDGVVNRRSVTLVRDETQLEILPGVPEAVARLTEAGYRSWIAAKSSSSMIPHATGRWFVTTTIRSSDR